MKLKIRNFIIFFAMVTFLVGIAYANEGPNLALNHNLETLNDSGFPRNWIITSLGENKVEVDHTNYHSPNTSIKFSRKEAQKYTAIDQWIQVNGGSTYRLGAWVKGTQNVDILWTALDANNQLVQGASSKVTSKLSDDFTYVFTEKTVPAEVAWLVIRAEIWAPGTGEAWIDDFELRRIDNLPPNLPANVVATPSQDNKVVLNWMTPPPAADGDLPVAYNIYRSTVSGFTPKLDNRIIQGITTNTFVDSQSDYYYPPRSIYYKITSLDQFGNESEGYEVVVRAKEDRSATLSLAQNGDLEKIGSNNFPFRWAITCEGANKVEVDHIVYNSSNSSIKFTRAEARKYTAIYQEVFSVKVGATYRLSAWVKGTQNVDLTWLVYDANNQYISGSSSTATSPQSDDFRYVFTEKEIPAGAAKVMIRAEIWAPATGEAWVDDIEFKEMDLIPPNPVNSLSGIRREDGSVTLSWEPPNVAGDNEIATYYQVWRANNLQMDDAVLIGDLINTTTYLDGSVSYDLEQKNLVDFYYQVIAFDRVNQSSENNPILVMEAEKDTMPPRAPQNISIERLIDGSVYISWDEPGVAPDGDQAMCYSVYRGENSNFLPKKDNKIGLVYDTTFIDNEVRYELTTEAFYYRIASHDNVYNEAVSSEAIKAAGACAIEGTVVLKEEQTTVKDAIITIDGEEYRFITQEDGKFEILLPEGEYTICCVYNLYHNYKMEVKAVAGGEINILIELERDLEPPLSPLKFIADISIPGMVVLTWKQPAKASDGDLPIYYNIFKGLREDFETTVENCVAVGIINFEWIDKEVKAGINYFYKIKAFDDAENPSLDVLVSASPIAPPLANLIKPIKGEPVVLGAAKLQWEERTGAYKYEVQISSKKTFENDDTITISTGETFIPIDQANEFYEGRWFWCVKTYYSNGVESDYSEPEEFIAVKKTTTFSIPYVSCYPQLIRTEQNLEVNFILTRNANTTVELFDSSGRKICLLEKDQVRAVGENKIFFSINNAKGLKNGLYFINIIAVSENEKIKAITRLLILR